MRETWYVLENGTTVHPSEVALNDRGRLAHKSGLVAMRDDGETPRSRGVVVDETAPLEKKPATPPAPAKIISEMRPEHPPEAVAKRPYKTRQTKAR